MPKTGDRLDPFLNFNFRVEIAGVQVAAFHECSGLDSSVDVIEHREGGGPILKLPGNAKFSNIVLKRGLTSNQDFYDLHRDCINGRVTRIKSGSIILMDRAGRRSRALELQRRVASEVGGPEPHRRRQRRGHRDARARPRGY